MKTTLACLTLPALLAGLVPACSDDARLRPPPGELVSSASERDPAPSVSADDVQTLVSSNTAFAVDAYRLLAQRDDDGNVVASPLSVSTALAMTYGGARGDTEAQMAGALRYVLPQEQLHSAFNWLDLELGSRGRGAAGADGKAFRLTITNATFGQLGHGFLPEYLDLLAVHYGAGMALLDFEQEPERSRQEINAWVADRTEDRIPELLPQGAIKPGTRLVLTNAVYFNAAWKTPFSRSLTATGTFHAPAGAVAVPMMYGEPAGMRHASGPGYQAISLPYSGDELDMVIIVPDAGTLQSFEASLDATLLQAVFASLSASAYQAVTMPAFEFRSRANMVEIFQALGLRDAFTEDADFSGMDGTRDLQISAIVHEAFIKVNEAGTEAAAATGVVVDVTSAPLAFEINRPFLFAIRDVPTGSVVFLGRVTDPSR